MSKADVSRQARAEERRNGLPIDAIADRTRRAVLSTLRSRGGRIATADLAALLAGDDRSSDDAPRTESERVHVQLVHAHLPKLEEAQLVDWDADQGTVALGDHPALHDERFERMIEVDAEDWDGVLEAVGSPMRRTVLAVLEAEEGLERSELAQRVVARMRDVRQERVDDAAVDDLLVSLRHSHLPALRDLSLVEVDGETIRYGGHEDLDAEWLHL